jgi:poly(hydroxyalkanoate) synthase III subunit E
VTPQTNPFAAWLEFMARLQQPGEPAAAPQLPFATPMIGFLETYRSSLEAFTSALGSGGTNVRWTDPAAVLDWMKTLAAPVSVGGTDPVAKHPLLAGLRHVYAGASDAVGWGLYTKLGEALGEVGRAQAAASESQAKVWKAIGEIWTSAQTHFGATLRGMVERRESFADVQAFLRAWAAALDEATHAAMQTESGLALTAEVNRAASDLRLAQNRAVEVFSELYNIPTRAELDEAYRLIHELRKEVRALKKCAPGS